MTERTINKELAMRIYRIMIEFQYREDFSMTTREIATVVGLKSNSDISAHVRWLVQNGYAKQRGKQTRAIPYDDNGGVL